MFARVVVGGRQLHLPLEPVVPSDLMSNRVQRAHGYHADHNTTKWPAFISYFIQNGPIIFMKCTFSVDPGNKRQKRGTVVKNRMRSRVFFLL